MDLRCGCRVTVAVQETIRKRGAKAMVWPAGTSRNAVSTCVRSQRPKATRVLMVICVPWRIVCGVVLRMIIMPLLSDTPERRTQVDALRWMGDHFRGIDFAARAAEQILKFAGE